MAKGDVLVRMKADVSNYDANIAKARKTLDGFKQDNLTLGGIMNQSTKSIMAAAAQYASFAAVIGTVASGFAEAASKGMQMSKEAEGVKAAFDRLNKPGLLDNLREATHGTVNDLELMKQAVKFDNFNLSLEQMGTMLAFAQQQAKDTGQDVGYLVDSIVTGLGRKSLPILDNLGLSAEEIKNRMKETGDMTKAVADIIQERMEAAGGYVETAADRAAQGQARLDNAMKELGDTMNSLTGAGATLWTDLKIGAIDLANNAIRPLIQMFNSLANFLNGPSKEDIVTRGMTDVTDTVDDNGRLIRKNAIPSIPEITVSGTAPKTTRRSGGGRSSSKGFDISSIAFDPNKAMLSAVKGTDEGPSEIWKAIHIAHMYRKTKLDDLSLIANIVSADQSWKKSSGHAFEEMVKEMASLSLQDHGIEIVLQRDMSTLLKAGEIANEPRDISWLKEQVKKAIFDLYAIMWKDGKRYCFGCLQAKTSIRDRVTRDREPSIHAMQSYFWSAVFVLDGDFLKMPKFINMVNGGSVEFPENGWHGMYSFTTEESNDRIYGIDISFDRFVEHALKASKQWRLLIFSVFDIAVISRKLFQQIKCHCKCMLGNHRRRIAYCISDRYPF